MEGKMKVAVMNGIGKMGYTTRDIPTPKDDEVLGWTRKLFTGHEYAAEGKATAAYLAVRDSKLHIGVGYRNDAGEYELVAIESESWVEAAGLPFDELGKD